MHYCSFAALKIAFFFYRPIGENWQYMTPLEKRLLEQREGDGGGAKQ